MRRVFTAVVICSAALLTGCGGGPTNVCTGDFPALRITVRDSLTGTAAASGAIATATRRGDTAETIIVPNDTSRDGVPIPLGSLPGTYDVLLKKAGYADWTKSGIVVETSNCHLQTVSLEALIRKL